jgi:hypothetical protein
VARSHTPLRPGTRAVTCQLSSGLPSLTRISSNSRPASVNVSTMRSMVSPTIAALL